jgi:ankyrin repeat protein
MTDDKDIDLLAVAVDLAFRAINRGDWIKLKELITSEPRILNLHARDKRTLLMHAAMAGHTSTINLLLTSGAEINEKDRDGWSAIRFAAHCENIEATQLLVERGAETDIFVAVALADKEATLNFLKQQPRLVSANDGLGARPLHWAAEFSHREIVELLLRSGAKANDSDYWSSTALHMTAQKSRNGCVEVAAALLDHGAEINCRDRSGDTAIHMAARRQRQDLVEFLLTRGAKAGTRNELGNTPLHGVVARLNQDAIRSMVIAKMLLDAGADINARNENGETPLAVASQREHPQIVEYLRRHGGVE